MIFKAILIVSLTLISLQLSNAQQFDKNKFDQRNANTTRYGIAQKGAEIIRPMHELMSQEKYTDVIELSQIADKSRMNVAEKEIINTLAAHSHYFLMDYQSSINTHKLNLKLSGMSVAKHSTHLLTIAAIYMELEQYQLAIEYFDELLSYQKINDPLHLYKKSLAHFKLNQLEKAQKFINESENNYIILIEKLPKKQRAEYKENLTSNKETTAELKMKIETAISNKVSN